MRKRKICVTLLLAGVLGVLICAVWPQSAHAQAKTRNMTRGRLWNAFYNSGTMATRPWVSWSDTYNLGMAYPGTYARGWGDYEEFWGQRNWPVRSSWKQDYAEDTNTLLRHGVWIATIENGEKRISNSGPRYLSDDVEWLIHDASQTPVAAIGYNDDRSSYWPGAGVPTSEVPIEIHNYRYDQYMDSDKDNWPEEMITTKWKLSRSGIVVTRTALSWSYTGFNDFIIIEHVFENTGGMQLDDTYFSFMNTFSVAESGNALTHYNTWRRQQAAGLDDWYRYTDSPNYAGPAGGMGLKLSYQWDGDFAESLFDDTGEPLISAVRDNFDWQFKEGALRSVQYVGFGPIDADPTDGFVNDTETYVAPKVADQPVSVRWWEVRSAGDFDQPDKNVHSEVQMYDLLSDPEVQSDPSINSGWSCAHTYGPYDLGPGEKVKIVIAFAAGSAAGDDPILPFSRSGDQSKLPLGEPVLIENMKSAKLAYALGYDLYDPPPDVGAELSFNLDAQNRLTWSGKIENASNPDYTGSEAQDIAGYRVYRTEFRFGDWELAKDIPATGASTYMWEDEKSVAGFDYFYQVRAYAEGHSDWTNGTQTLADLPEKVQTWIREGYEGGFVAPEQRVPANLPARPMVPGGAELDRFDKQVVVVPNPWKKDGTHAYPGTLSLRFLNLPSKCQILIFSVSGDLMGEINHDDASVGETAWTQVTRTVTSTIPSGVYYFVVKSLAPESLGKIQQGTFMVLK